MNQLFDLSTSEHSLLRMELEHFSYYDSYCEHFTYYDWNYEHSHIANVKTNVIVRMSQNTNVSVSTTKTRVKTRS